MSAPAIVWFRQDLRLADNPALSAAVESGRPIIFLYILDDETPAKWRMGAAQRWWLNKSLGALDAELRRKGCSLTLRRGAAAAVLAELAAETGAELLCWNRCYEPFAVERDKALKAKLSIEIKSFGSALLHEPWEVKTGSGDPFKVFTPFWRAARSMPVRAALAAPRALKSYAPQIATDPLEAWALTPRRPNWALGFESEWRPGEAGARKALESFVDERMTAYPGARDQLDQRGTSELSPHLHFGEITPAQIAAAASDGAGSDKFMSEIGWRDFSHSLLFHWPTLPESNWRASFDAFPWANNEANLRTWQRGETGYPVVDAGMRQLWATGWMHNRARMIAASFLIKHLLTDWREGQAWFWDTLVDADLANNAASWQWVAGSGADAAPYFRIFNPVVQGQRYDADGVYVRRWVPELAKLDTKFIHQPWLASAPVLANAGIKLGTTYPKPIVDHGFARSRALEAFASIANKN
jgi:deoxyribodipyrimidine photo-lyase